MIEVSKSQLRCCNLCHSESEDVHTITFRYRPDGNGVAIMLCDKCRHELIRVLQQIQDTPPYKPVCPAGYTDCICDPAYIQYHYPKWYTKLYGDRTPEEAVGINCKNRVTEDGDCDEYDDEDK